MNETEAKNRLEYLRQELRAERLSWSEVAELQSLAPHIDRGDVELLEAAGVPEFPDRNSCPICNADLGPSSSFPWHLPDEDCRAIRDPA